ncbi:metallophosphoesterase [Nocardia colli]|uniref:Metallophosphoesterase n=2 Tax=Nocardia colli TaxID=2545717 RepID=A0A5N0EAG6_9NOCA|nr:metallophosphoesterase [Nocardia colli]
MWLADAMPAESAQPSIRIAAVADTHMRDAVAGRFRPELLRVDEHADVLLLAGDLTEGGRLAEADLLCAEIADLPVPVVAVLGNHDHDHKLGFRISAQLSGIGVHMLEGTAITLELNGIQLGIAGVMGGSGGFPGYPGTPDEGTEEHRARMRRGPLDALLLRQALDTLETEIRVALMHFSPVVDTLIGEPPKIFPGLGCHALGDAVDAGRASLAVHGHAHGGTEIGCTAGGVPVRNVSYPVIGRPYAVYDLIPVQSA